MVLRRPTALTETAFGAVCINVADTPTVKTPFSRAVGCKMGPAIAFVTLHRLPFVYVTGRTKVYVTRLIHYHFKGHDPIQLICTRLGVLPGEQNQAEPT